MTTEKKAMTIDDIPGWFPGTDQRVFEHFLSGRAVVLSGDLVELGAFQGKSAALMAKHLHPGEKFTVCDLFGAPAGDGANDLENSSHYPTLTLDSFKSNYLGIHDELPDIVQDVTSVITDHVKPQSARFVHVDASHLYEHVAIDVESSRTMLKPDAVVVFDDFRSTHTPGVSAAVWEAVFNRGLNPIAITFQKMYATFGDPVPHQRRLADWLTDFKRFHWETQAIGRWDLIRIWPPKNSS